ncbi:multidrug efflux RND transporter permease subunit [Methylomonas koyamae]|uniref:Multidrug transporter subunit MdtB n=1 Tax=Methylomonas koyamae TaxID=702114 RepID=A0A291IMV1_9GAMM|nr:multidrug efflux RND transporter permease subunit [Methylomonas koyamae]ATG91538.1 multidrug transporter subunit MdtC [Methylomonas koyamae]OAI26920.1 multidrug transporter subunit MdtB [Methylomonas koyamae]
MNISAAFVRRPVATTLLTLGLALAGLLAFWQLPVAPLPQVDFPTISVSASLPGAAPETMAATVATPLERALGRIAGINEMTSASALGNTRITLQFDLSRDIDGAARDVQAAINAAASLLPSNLPNRPSYRKVNPADSPILILALTSTTLSRGQMYDAASTVLAQKIAQLPGVGQVTAGGSSLPAVRVELNPDALAKYGIGLDQVAGAIAAGNTNRPKGALESGGRHWQIQTNGQVEHAADYLPLIVAYRNGAPVRIADLGTAVDSVEDLRSTGLKNGEPAVLLIVNKQPGANIIETVDRVKAMLPQLRALLPAAVELSVVSDRSQTIRASVAEVEHSLLIAVALVIMVVLLFLRRLRTALIPIVAVPVSLIGACGVMYLCGYSLDNLSLMALTIATGFVVDDAIVVLENSNRHLEQGLPPLQAALRGVGEVGFTVLAMSLSLIAVFTPILLMGGIVGRLFREFAVTLSAAVLVSLVVSLTVTPMLCAHWLQAEPPRPPSRASAATAELFDKIRAGYRHSLAWALHHPRLMLALLAACIAANAYLYVIVPKGFFPVQDNGRLSGTIQADQSISFQAMQRKLRDFAEILHQDPAINDVVGFAGGMQNSNSGLMFAILKPPEQRDRPIAEINRQLREKLADEPGASLFLQPVQDLRIGGRGSAALYEFALQSDDLNLLREWTPKIVAALAALPELADVNTNQQDKGRQIALQVDRDKAARLGVSQAAIDSALHNAFGQRPVSVIYKPLNQYRVVMELAPQYWRDPQTLRQLYVGSATGIQIPLATLAEFRPGNTPLTVNHQGQFAAATVSFNLKPGVSLSDATRLIERTLRDIGTPAQVRGSFQGSAKAFQESLRNQPWLIAAALFSIYIVLGILYESYIHPLTILSTLPSAGMGALLALMACDTEFSIIALIGVVLLIGIVKKNAIMMIDFALHAQREQGLDPEQAIFTACLQRFRPIMMTTLAALLGALPLALGSGYGAELRQPLGISIVGGLLVSQLLTLYTTPVVYLALDRLSGQRRKNPAVSAIRPSQDLA